MENKVNNFRMHYYNCELIVKKYSKYIKNNHILDIGSNVGFFSEAILKNINYFIYLNHQKNILNIVNIYY